MNLGRRAFLARCLAGASLGAGVLLYAREQHVHLPHGPHAPATEPSGPVLHPEIPEGRPRLSFYALGDTGWKTSARSEVVAAMAAMAADARPEFALLLGDNFYPDGVRSVDDAAWRTHFEEAFGAAELQFPFYPALGNHDHAGNTQAQVEYSLRGGRWRMPGSYHAFSRTLAPGCEAEFFVLDTTPLRLGDRVADEQIRWLEDKLARSKAHWRIVLGHHPAVSAGNSGGSTTVRELLDPLFERYGVDLYLSGHDHDLQLLATDAGYLQIVSGAGSSPREVGRRDESLFAETGPGFAWILASDTELWIQFVSASRGPRFTHCISRPA